MKGVLKSAKLQGTCAWFGLLRPPKPGQLKKASGHDGNDDSGMAEAYEQLCTEFQDVFQEPKMPPRRQFDHRIDRIDESAMPPRPRQYRLSQVKMAEV